MANDNRTPFRSILASIVKPVEQPKPKPLTNRDRFEILSAIHYKLDEAGLHVEIDTLDWICREFEDSLRDLHGQRQYYYEQWRKAKDADDFLKSDPKYRRGER